MLPKTINRLWNQSLCSETSGRFCWGSFRKCSWQYPKHNKSTSICTFLSSGTNKRKHFQMNSQHTSNCIFQWHLLAFAFGGFLGQFIRWLPSKGENVLVKHLINLSFMNKCWLGILKGWLMGPKSGGFGMNLRARSGKNDCWGWGGAESSQTS